MSQQLFIPAPGIQANFKPDFPVELDPNHPLRNNLLAYCLHAEIGSQVQNLANGSFGTFSGVDLSRIIGSEGRAIQFSGATAGKTHYPAQITPTNKFTIMARVNCQLSGAVQNWIDDDNYPSTPRAFQFRQNASNQVEFITFDSAATAYTLDGATIPLNTNVWVGASVSGTNMAVWLNTTKTTGTMTNPQVSTDSTIWIGESKIYTGAQPFKGIIYEWLMFNTVLSDAEIVNLQQNPYELLRPKQRDLWLMVGSSNANNLVGTSAETQSASAGLSIAVPMVAASVQVQTSSGVASVGIPLAGSATATQSASGSLQITVPLNAQAIQQQAA